MCALAGLVSKPVFALDQEPDDVIVAQRSCSGKALEKTSRGDIIGFAGDTVREPAPLYSISRALQLALPVPLHPILCNSPCSLYVQDGEVQASNKLGAYTVPTNFLNNTVEAKAAAKKLGAATAKQAATEQAKKAKKKPDAPVARR